MISIYIKFIKKNQGCSKQYVVNGFKGTYARVTVWKIIDQLLQYGFLVVKTDAHNRQTWNLFIDDSNTLFLVTEDINIIEDLFSTIIKELNLKIKG